MRRTGRADVPLPLAQSMTLYPARGQPSTRNVMRLVASLRAGNACICGLLNGKMFTMPMPTLVEPTALPTCEALAFLSKLYPPDKRLSKLESSMDAYH